MNIKTCAASLILIVGLSGATCAQQAAVRPWQHLSDPSLRELVAGWKTPPPEYGPEPYYGLNGQVTLDDVRRDLDTMKSLGFHAVTVQYGYGEKIGYLSPEYFSFFREFVREAKQRNLRVWIVDDAGYPSGFAGGRFTSEHPELRMQALAVTQQKPVAEGDTFEASLPPAVVAVTAIGKPDGSIVQVPVNEGHVAWKAPAGNWTVYVVEHVFRTSPTRSDTNPQRVKDASQSLEDYLDPAATAQYLAFTHEQYKKAVGDEFGKTILGFRGDEPDYSIPGLPWTPKFFAAFESRKGYDIRPFLAVLLQPKSTPLTQKQLLAKADYYDVFADLFRDGFFKPQADWCSANGLEYQVHLNHEEMQLDLTHSEGDFFRDMRYVQVPGIDSIWHQIWTDTVSDFPRLAASAAHVYGHPRAFTESFAAYRPEPDVTMARYILNEQFVRGVNLVETMYFPASVAGHGGPSALMRDAGYPALMEYTSRMSYLMSQGRPSAEVALLLPSASLWMGSVKTDDTFVSSERLLSENQVDFDVVDEDAIGQLLKLDRGSFVSGSGNRYRTVLVPNATILSFEEFERLKEFTRSGGKTVFLSGLPQWVAQRNQLEARKVSDSDFGWATVVPGDLPRVPTPPAQPPATPPEPMSVPQGFWEGVEKQLPSRFVRTGQRNTGLRVARRELKDASVLLLFNESGQKFSDRVIIGRRDARAVEVWDPQTGTSHSVPFQHADGGIQFELEMSPDETRVLVIH